MNHYPVFLATRGRRILLSGGGDAALAKLRLLMKTEATVEVFATDAAPEIEGWAEAGRIVLYGRSIEAADATGAALIYAADEDPKADARTAAIGRAAGVLTNIVDDLSSDFYTPAMVDRAPVVVAIGTEGTAPVLARQIKRRLEEMLPERLGGLARIADLFRPAVSNFAGWRRRALWSEWFSGTREASAASLAALVEEHRTAKRPEGHVHFVGAGPGDPDLLTLKARKALDAADVVLHDRLVPQPIIELVRREATIVETGKTGHGPSMPQAEIDALIVEHARRGAQVVRLKAGDPTVFGRLDEETEACRAAGIAHTVVPGITAASAAAASMGASLTRRGRNSELRIVTGHDVDGFADGDWRALAQPGAVAAIYMGRKAARYWQGRLLMHGADPATPVTVAESVGCPDARLHVSTLSRLPEAADVPNPAVILLGLAPHEARTLEVAL